MLTAAGPRTMEALQAWDVCFSELVRQVFVQCNDRGELLGRVRRAHQHGRWLTTALLLERAPPCGSIRTSKGRRHFNAPQ